MSDPFKDAKNDPFKALKNVLDPVFYLESMRNGKYIYAEIQQLKEAVQNYDPMDKKSFINLIKALRAALPKIEKWKLPFDTIKESMDALAKEHLLPVLDWDKYLSHSNTSQNFQRSVLNQGYQEIKLIPWLTEKSGREFTHCAPHIQANILIDYRDHLGFSQKVTHHLKDDPEFLFHLIMESEKNFSKICNTRLILYLTDEQIAKAIIKFLPKFVQEHENPFVQVEQLVDKINAILSNGRSLSTLLRSADAKPILEDCILFQIYQSDKYQNRSAEGFPPPREEGGFKPIF